MADKASHLRRMYADTPFGRFEYDDAGLMIWVRGQDDMETCKFFLVPCKMLSTSQQSQTCPIED